jgi:hypothetical protein
MIFSGGGAGEEELRRQENLRAMRELVGYEKKDEERADRGDLLESLGAHGSLTFGFVLSGVDTLRYTARCTAAVTPKEVVLLNDEPAEDPQVIAHIPREGLDIQLTGPSSGDTSVTIGRYEEGSEVEPEEEKVGAQVVLKWQAGQVAVGFATQEGAQEAVDLLRRKLSQYPA